MVKKHVIFDCERMKYPYTGLYSFCKELGRALISVNEHQRISFYVPEDEKGVFGKEAAYLIQKERHKVLPLNTHGFDVWHCTYQASRYLPLGKGRLKMVSTIHDLNYLHQDKSVAKQKKYLRRVQQLIDRSDHIVTISNFVRDQVLEHLNLRGKRIEVIYNGKNRPEAAPGQRPPSVEARPFFFSIGTVTEKKNFHVLPPLLKGNDHQLVIAGLTQHSNYHKKIMAEAVRFGVADRVKLIGPVTEAEKFWLYKNCVAFCFPSLAEGFGLPIIEAMQFGTPVLLSKETSLPEIGGPSAIYFDDLGSESVQSVATRFLNNQTSPQVKQELIQWAAQFDWDTAARRYLDIYSTL